MISGTVFACLVNSHGAGDRFPESSFGELFMMLGALVEVERHRSCREILVVRVDNTVAALLWGGFFDERDGADTAVFEDVAVADGVRFLGTNGRLSVAGEYRQENDGDGGHVVRVIDADRAAVWFVYTRHNDGSAVNSPRR